jgi:hypothetical protein
MVKIIETDFYLYITLMEKEIYDLKKQDNLLSSETSTPQYLGVFAYFLVPLVDIVKKQVLFLGYVPAPFSLSLFGD